MHTKKMNNSTNEDEHIFLNAEDCKSIFQIPAHVVESYGANLPSYASLRFDDSGKKWRVSVEKFKGNYFFTNGWKEFAEQVDIMSLDFLKFTSASSSKQKGTNQEKTRKRSDGVNGRTKDKRSRVNTVLSFTKDLKKHHRYRVDIPHSFAVKTGLRRGDKIKLNDREGTEWPVYVLERTRIHSFGGGWTNYVIDNKLTVGSKVTFTWLSGNIIQARVELGTSKELVYSATNRREKCW